MPRTALWLRVFVGLLLAILPPILLLLAALFVTESIFHEQNANLVAIVVFAGALAWTAILAVVFTGGLADEFRSFLSVAERGGTNDPDAGTAYQQLAASLDERNRQIATLAQQASVVPIDDDPRAVVGSLVSAVRRVMRDATWQCAVLASPDAGLLPAAVYHASEDGRPPDAVGDMEQWASVTKSEESSRHIEGPWGAFTVIELAASGDLRALLYAPWEGRRAPTRAEMSLLDLVGQHAGTALEHSLLYARVRSQADELNRLAAVQADFLRGVTHDLQTPLTSIGALATELRANDAVPESARKDLEAISHQADRLRRLVSQLLVASRLEAGVLMPQQEVFAVKPVIERTWAALRADRPFALTVDGPAHLAVADPDRLEQVLWAILDNAVKYSPARSPISVRIAPRDGMLAVTISDQGSGMDAATQQRAFEQFYRSQQARKLAPDGSGVGLYAASGLMEAMGGTLEIHSELGAGTSMTLHVPSEMAEATGD